jgi:hypothetical protein
MRVAIIMTLLLCSITAFAQAQVHSPNQVVVIQLDEIQKRFCEFDLPEGFRCGVLFDVGIPVSDGMIASIVGEDVSQISVYLDGELYTVAYDPPLKRDDKFVRLRRGAHVPVRIEKNQLILQWPDQTRCKGKVIRRESVFPNQPQPA